MYKVLIVDDEVAIRNGIAKLIPFDELGIQLMGYAGSGEQALAAVREEKPDILLTDIKMPGMDGLKLIAELSGRHPEMRFVILSGYDDFGYAREALRYRVDNYLLKPIDRDELIQTLSGIVEQLDRLKSARRAQHDRFMEHLLWRLFRRQMDEGELSERLHYLGVDERGASQYRVLMCPLPEQDFEPSAMEIVESAHRRGSAGWHMLYWERSVLIWVSRAEQADAFGLIPAGQVAAGRPVADLLHIADSYDDATAQLNKWTSARSAQEIAPRDLQIIEYIHAHYREDLSLPILAERFSLTPAYLGTLIKAATGELFSVYLNRYRIDRAREKLALGQESAGAIGRAVGFRDANYFYKVFYKYAGCYPTEYRTSSRRGKK